MTDSFWPSAALGTVSSVTTPLVSTHIGTGAARVGDAVPGIGVAVCCNVVMLAGALTVAIETVCFRAAASASRVARGFMGEPIGPPARPGRRASAIVLAREVGVVVAIAVADGRAVGANVVRIWGVDTGTAASVVGVAHAVSNTA